MALAFNASGAQKLLLPHYEHLNSSSDANLHSLVNALVFRYIDKSFSDL